MHELRDEQCVAAIEPWPAARRALRRGCRAWSVAVVTGATEVTDARARQPRESWSLEISKRRNDSMVSAMEQVPSPFFTVYFTGTVYGTPCWI